MNPPWQPKGARAPGIGLAVLILLSGCAGRDTSPSWTPTGDPIVDGKAAIEHGPSRDRVLWQYRTALAALRQGNHEDAKFLLDDALITISGIYGPDSQARKSRRYFRRESKKTFIGEPYERVMAYYYRGIIYWMEGEIDNARACFRSGQIMDGDAENSQYAGDYVLLDYLDGLATAKLAGDGQDALARSRAAAKMDRPPDFDLKANVLFFVELGQGPVKYATGEYGEELRFVPGRSKATGASVRAGDHTSRCGVYDDLTFQATTRGGRVMDHVLANKAVFKKTTSAVGDAAIISGAIMASQRGRNSSVDEVGAGFIVAGILSKIISGATTPAADTRAWESLPQYLGYGSLRLEPGVHEVTVEFHDAHGRPLGNRTRVFEVSVTDTGRDTVVFVSSPGE